MTETMTEDTSKNVLCDNGKSHSRFQISSKRAKQIFYGSIIFIASVQTLATLTQIIHLCQYLKPDMSLRYSLGVMATLLNFPAGVLISLAFNVIIVKKKLVGKIWTRIDKILPGYSVTTRSALFAAFWGVLSTAGTLILWLLNKNMWNFDTIRDYGILLLVKILCAFIFFKLYGMRNRHLACFIFCIGIGAYRLIESEMYVYDRAASLPRIERTPRNEPIFKLAERVHFDPNHIMEAEGYGGAYIVETFFSEQIVVGRAIEDDQVAAVFAHELGHRAYHDDAKQYAGRLLKETLWNAALFYVVAPNVELYGLFGLETEPIIAAFAIKDVFSNVFSIVTGPIFHAFSIFREYRADAYAVGLGSTYGEGLIKFFGGNSINITSSKLFEYVFVTHPASDRRIEVIKKLIAGKKDK